MVIPAGGFEYNRGVATRPKLGTYEELEMKKLFGLSLFALSLMLSVPGCGDSGEATNIADNAEQSAIEAYDAAVAEEMAGMEADAPGDE